MTPNASQLVASICLAIIAFIVSGQIMPLMQEGMDFGYFTHVNMVLGVVVGWVVMGKRAGRGVTPAINNGLTGVAVMVFWGLFVQGCYEMVDRALANRYGGPFEAVAAIFELSLDFAMDIFVPNIILTLLIGGILAGLATEYAQRKWR